MKHNALTTRVILLLVSSDLIESFTMFAFKKLSMAIPSTMAFSHLASDLPALGIAILQSPFLWLGIVSITLSFIVWGTVLSNIDLSVAYPLASLSFVFIPIVSIFFFQEHISLMRWVGIGCIAAGICLLSFDSGKSKETA